MLEKPLPPPPAHPEDEPLVCVELNASWIPYIIGQLQPMKYGDFWEGTYEQKGVAMRDTQNLITLFQIAEDCGNMASNCCDGSELLIVVQTRVTLDGRIEISIDNGATWHPSPSDPGTTVIQQPPPVTLGTMADKCDAASNGLEHFRDMINRIATIVGLGASLTEIIVAIAEVILEIIISIATGGAITPIALALGGLIFAAVKGVVDQGEVLFREYWSEENYDILFCALYCNILPDGSFDDAHYFAFLAKVTADLPASPAKDMVITAIRSMSNKGLSNMCSYGNAAAGDCASCECDCLADNYNIDGVRGTLIGRDEFSMTVQAVFTEGQYEAGIRVIDGMPCCRIVAVDTAGEHTSVVWNKCEEGYHNPYLSNVPSTGANNSYLCISVTPFTVVFTFAT